MFKERETYNHDKIDEKWTTRSNEPEKNVKASCLVKRFLIGQFDFN